MSIVHNWLWLDLETTGLDEHAGHILEVGAAVVDDGPAGTFEIVDSIDGVILPGVDGWASTMDPVVKEMHTKNGLLALIAQGHGCSLADTDAMLRAFVDEYADPGNKVILAGNSVHFDLRWCKKHMPKLAERLHYRVFDVSTLLQVARVWGPGLTEAKSEKHRALYDVQASVRSAKAVLDLIRAE